ncbi:hypothetical protein [Paraclostridium bifermentans]|uniref:hypothetical protein n=1 Tax=Paraclostridium bifermentans TaxID=1490 RepID=UPI00374E3B70
MKSKKVLIGAVGVVSATLIGGTMLYSTAISNTPPSVENLSEDFLQVSSSESLLNQFKSLLGNSYSAQDIKSDSFNVEVAVDKVDNEWRTEKVQFKTFEDGTLIKLEIKGDICTPKDVVLPTDPSLDILRRLLKGTDSLDVNNKELSDKLNDKPSTIKLNKSPKCFNSIDLKYKDGYITYTLMNQYRTGGVKNVQ